MAIHRGKSFLTDTGIYPDSLRGASRLAGLFSLRVSQLPLMCFEGALSDNRAARRLRGNVVGDLHEFCMSEAAQAGAKFVAAARQGWTLTRAVLACQI